MTTASQIYQILLDRMTEAVRARDTEAFSELLDYPYEIRVMDGSVICRDVSDLARALDSFAEQLEDIGVTDFVRSCDAAQFLASDHISGFHTTWVKSEKGEELSPYVTRLNLFRSSDGQWRANLSDTALRSEDWNVIHNWVSKATGASFAKNISDQDQRLKLFQTILDRTSAAFISGDLQGWLNVTSLPFQLVSRHGVETFATQEEVKDDFERYQREFEAHGVTDIFRQAKTAELIDGDQMVGTYSTHIMRGATHVVPPWDASMTLRREAGLWRVTTVMRAIGHLNWSAMSRTDIEDIHQDTPKKGDLQ